MADEPAEVAITSEMIEAGYATLLASGRVTEPLRADKLLVAEIFEVMEVVRRREEAVAYRSFFGTVEYQIEWRFPC